MNKWGAALWSWQGSLTQNRQTQSVRYSAAWCRAECVIYISENTATLIVDRPYPIMLSGVLFGLSELISKTQRMRQREGYSFSVFLSLKHIQPFSCTFSYIFFCKSNNPPPSFICCLQFLLVRVWLSVPGRDYHSWDCPLCSRAPLFHSLASLPLSAFRGRLFPTRKGRESPPCARL